MNNKIQIYHSSMFFCYGFSGLVLVIILGIFLTIVSVGILDYCISIFFTIIFILFLLLYLNILILEHKNNKPYITICDEYFNVHLGISKIDETYLYSDIDCIDSYSDFGNPCFSIYLKEDAKEKYLGKNILLSILHYLYSFACGADRIYSTRFLDMDSDDIINMLQEKLEQYNLRTNGNNIE